MFRFFDILGKIILGGAWALVMLVPLAGAHANGFSVLYTFMAPPDVEWPTAGVIADSAGNLYGTAYVGGDVNCPGFMGYGCGGVFKVAPDGTETVLYAFTGTNGDGEGPQAGLIQDKEGNLYGTTSGGGADDVGTVFKVTPKGKETVLYYFQGGSDGYQPTANLIADSAGNFYGTTLEGGGSAQCPLGCGTIFKLAPDGTESVLYAFQGGSDGRAPVAGLTMDKKGNLYGTTEEGGGTAGCAPYSGCGTVFKLAPTGTETVLYAFQGGSDGAWPQYGSLIMDKKGNLFGTTGAGGIGNCSAFNPPGCGTVFEVTPKGKETMLHAFSGDEGGGNPVGGLTAINGNFYGTTVAGGALNFGTAFRLAQDGTYKVLYSFTHGSDSSAPSCTLISKKDYLYGTSYGGGTTNGAVFKLKE